MKDLRKNQRESTVNMKTYKITVIIPSEDEVEVFVPAGSLEEAEAIAVQDIETLYEDTGVSTATTMYFNEAFVLDEVRKPTEEFYDL